MSEPPPTIEEIRRLSIDDVAWSTRVYGVFRAEGILTLGAIELRTASELLRMPNFGKKSLDEVKEVLAERGLSLTVVNDPPPDPRKQIGELMASYLRYSPDFLRGQILADLVANWLNEMRQWTTGGEEPLHIALRRERFDEFVETVCEKAQLGGGFGLNPKPPGRLAKLL